MVDNSPEERKVQDSKKAKKSDRRVAEKIVSPPEEPKKAEPPVSKAKKAQREIDSDEFTTVKKPIEKNCVKGIPSDYKALGKVQPRVTAITPKGNA